MPERRVGTAPIQGQGAAVARAQAGTGNDGGADVACRAGVGESLTGFRSMGDGARRAAACREPADAYCSSAGAGAAPRCT